MSKENDAISIIYNVSPKGEQCFCEGNDRKDGADLTVLLCLGPDFARCRHGDLCVWGEGQVFLSDQRKACREQLSFYLPQPGAYL